MLETTALVLGMEELLNADAAGRIAKRGAKDFIVHNIGAYLDLFDRRPSDDHARHELGFVDTIQ